MIWLSDTSALSLLAETQLLLILPGLYGEVSISTSVLRECTHTKSPQALKDLIRSKPSWLLIVPDPCPVALAFEHLDPGEASLLTLAAEAKHPTAVILDDGAARAAARKHGVAFIGVVGILEQAARAGMVDFDLAVTALKTTNFRIQASVIDEIQRRLREERR